MSSATLTRDELIAAGKVLEGEQPGEFLPEYGEIFAPPPEEYLAHAFSRFFRDIREELVDQLKPGTTTKRYYKYPEAANYLRIKVSTLQNKVYNKEITHAKLGSSVVFDIVDLDEYVATHKVAAKKVKARSES